MAHQTIQSSAATGILSATAIQTMPQALPLILAHGTRDQAVGTDSIDVMRLKCS
jgi:hypothetical protein